MGDINAVICGSYRKHFSQMLELKTFLERAGIAVLSPGGELTLPSPGMIQDPRALQDSVLAKIRASAFMVLVNVDGHVGRAATFEMGYAVSLGLQILAIEPVTDPGLAGYCRQFSEVFGRWRPTSLQEAATLKASAGSLRPPPRGSFARRRPNTGWEAEARR